MDSGNKEHYERPPTPAGQDEKGIIKDLQTGGCPICNHMEEVIFDFFAKWQYKLANDETVQKEYADELGFCPAHTWQLAAMASSWGLSRGYPKLLEHIAEELSKLIDISPNVSDNIEALVKGYESCRVCRLLRDKEETYTRRFVAFLEREEIRVAYSHSDGVCLGHLRLLVSHLTSREVMRFLMLETAKKLRETAEVMRRYALKHEALERDLINRDEKYAYMRALVHVAGARNVCAPHVRRIG
ncbi:MAG: hypothetical protein FJ139_03690 [Deltaproteobacteria bacterium]|nr:hypothetical protein [Deltaproteobacteria bacterium]